MSLYRGAGGASDATDDSTVNAVAGYASSAASSATSAANSATAASTSASAAATSASGAATSASSVATNATNAASSASLAGTYATQASNSKDAAAASATTASTRAGEASSSASNASSSAATATTKAGEASTSATASAASAVSSAASAASALAIYGNTAAVNAAVAAAAASATTSTTQAANSAASAGDAADSESLAFEHEQNAAEWASFAQGSANSAQGYSTAALAARDATLAAYDSFDDRYLGVKNADPTLDNDGNTLLAGSLYFNSTTNMMMLRAGNAWVAAYTSGGSPSFGNTVVNGTLNVTGTITGNLTGNVTGDVSGNAGTVTNGVYTTGNQTIAGTKTFSSTIAGSINGNAATATTATNVSGGTASVTTLTTSSTVTHNGGTANGVAYLNGSKVLTTGSALTFASAGLDIASTQRVTNYGTGFASGAGIEFDYGVNANVGRMFAFDRTSSTWKSLYFGGDLITYNISGTEGMRLTSTGLGIGTSSPATKLHIGSAVSSLSTAARFSTNIGGTPELLVLENAANRNTDRGTQISFYNPNGGTSQLGAAIFSANENSTLNGPEYLGFKTGTGGTISEKMRLNSSGNLGLGVTPSAWQTAFKAIQFGQSGAVYGHTSVPSTYLTSNIYQAGGVEYYITNGNSAKYVVNNNGGQHLWFTAPSGTAGAAITFTQALTLDSSGSLLVGDTSAPSNGINTAAVSTKGQGTSGSRRATASAMGVTSSLAQNATANTYTFGGYGGYGLFVAEGSDPQAAWRAAAIVWSTGAALTILNLGSSNITVASSGTTLTVQNTSSSAQAISWSMLVLG